MPKDNSYRILWISDIHFYDKNIKDVESNYLENLNKYLKQIFEKIDSLISNNLPGIKYIIFSGDIAQAGTKEDYDAFETNILEPLLRKFSDKNQFPQLFFIPGNHDLCYDSDFEFVYGYINAVLSGEIDYADFSLDNGLKDFKETFTNYTKFINDCRIKFPDNFKFKQDNLSYYHIDHNNRTIFTMLNSAWYSLGSEFNNIFAKYFLEEIINDGSILKETFVKWKEKLGKNQQQDNVLERIFFLNLKEKFNENGSQMINPRVAIKDLDKDFDKLMKYFIDYPDYVAITSFHHPLNWLQDGEYNIYNNGEPTELRKIINESDLVLVGHEHLHVNTMKSESKIDKTIYLKSGRFLECTTEERSFEGNWFSILEVNTDTKVLNHQAVSCTTNDIKIEELEQNHIIRTSYKMHLNAGNYKLTQDRRTRICKIRMDKYRLSNYLKDFLVLPSDLTLVSNRNFLIARNSASLNFYLKKIEDFKSENLINIITNVVDKNKIEIIRFVILDLNVDSAISANYEDVIVDRDEVLNKLVFLIDAEFDKFRVTFFEKITKNDMSNFKDLKFVMNVIPYWIFEQLDVNLP